MQAATTNKTDSHDISENQSTQRKSDLLQITDKFYHINLARAGFELTKHHNS
jgi:hypothetical protein